MMEPIAREREFYGAALGRATEGYASTGYGLPINQKMRFDELVKQMEWFGGADQDYSLLDIGSGTGDLLKHLDRLGIPPNEYVGLDLMPEMTEQAEANMKAYEPNSDWKFVTGDVSRNYTTRSLSPEGKPGHWDYVVSIAAYALKEDHSSQQEEIQRVQEAIHRMVGLSKKAVFVTLFSTWKTNIIPEELVLDPVTMFAWAKSQFERVDLIHSYAPFDFSLVIRPEKSVWRREYEKANA